MSVPVAALLPCPLQSTLLVSAAYHAQSSVLDLQFHDGTLYRFFDVPAACFQALLDSDSKGAFFNASIRNHFRYELVAELRKQN
jgi:hypothetical protein